MSNFLINFTASYFDLEELNNRITNDNDKNKEEIKNKKVGAEPRYSSLPAERARDDRPGAGDLGRRPGQGQLD